MESERIHAAASGDAQAFETLMSTYEKKIYCLCLRMMGNACDGEDAAQEAIFRIWRQIGQFQEKSSFSTWVYRITASVCIDALRKRERVSHSSLDALQEQGFDTPDDAPTPEQTLQLHERRKHMAQAITLVPDGMRAVFLLRDVHGLSIKETADALGLSSGTVKSRLSRAREQIAAILSRDEVRR